MEQPTRPKFPRTLAFFILATISASAFSQIEQISPNPPPPPQLIISSPDSVAPPATQPVSQIETWFTQLADRDANARESARTLLMSLHRAQLDDLKKIVAAHHPIGPAQAAALRQIVAQIYLAGDTYPVNPSGGGFLGVSLRVIAATTNAKDNVDPNARQVNAQPKNVARAPVIQLTRVAVQNCMPGFFAYPVLRDGDVVLSIVEQPTLAINTPADFINAVRIMPSGQTVHLNIERAGREMVVAVELSPRPMNLTIQPDATGQSFTADREVRADEYWKKHFEKLVEQMAM